MRVPTAVRHVVNCYTQLFYFTLKYTNLSCRRLIGNKNWCISGKVEFKKSEKETDTQRELTTGNFRWTPATSCYSLTWLQACASYCSSSVRWCWLPQTAGTCRLSPTLCCWQQPLKCKKLAICNLPSLDGVITLYRAIVDYSHWALLPTICWSVCVCVCLSSALWQNGWLDMYAVWDGRLDGSRDEASSWVWGLVHG